jgi:uncharacterized tellurite resistance protein B-like protein
MIDLVKRFFGGSEEKGPQDQAGVTGHDVRVATCALFLEMAGIDGEFSQTERDSILSILKRRFALSEEYASQLLDVSNEELKRSIDLWQFTNLINENYSRDEKIEIIELVWSIVYIDGQLNQHEDYLVHKLAKLLRLTHKELIDAKLRILGDGDPGEPGGVFP